MNTSERTAPQPPVHYESVDCARMEDLAIQYAEGLLRSLGDDKAILGHQALSQQAIASAVTSLKPFNESLSRMAGLLTGRNAGISLALASLKQRIDSVDPVGLSQVSWHQKLFTWYPGSDPLIKAVAKIAQQYGSVAGEIRRLIGELESESARLQQANNQISQSAEQLQKTKADSETAAYLCELILEQLEPTIRFVPDEIKKARLASAVQELAVKAMQLRAIARLTDSLLTNCQTVRSHNQGLVKDIGQVNASVTVLLEVGKTLRGMLATRYQIVITTTDDQALPFSAQIFDGPAKALESAQASHRQLGEVMRAGSQSRDRALLSLQNTLQQANELIGLFEAQQSDAAD